MELKQILKNYLDYKPDSEKFLTQYFVEIVENSLNTEPTLKPFFKEAVVCCWLNSNKYDGSETYFQDVVRNYFARIKGGKDDCQRYANSN